jgi:hypothetical protein
MKRLLALLAFGLSLIGAPVLAANCSTYPFTLTNGQTADASQVMANFNSILSCANTNLLAAPISGSSLAAGAAVANLGYTPLDIAGSNAMTGKLQLAAGTTTLTPLVIPIGTLNTAPVSGAIENDGTNFYGVNSAPARKIFAYADGSNSTGLLTTASAASTYAPLASPALTGSPTVGGVAIVLTNDPRLAGLNQTSVSAARTLGLTDAGTELYHPSADTTARAWVIPANASVAFPVGSKIEIVNDSSAGTITLSITSDTLEWFSTSISTGSRTLPAGCIVTITKVTSTKWVLAGAGNIS